MKKILAMLLCVIMVVSMAAMVSAEEVTAAQVNDAAALAVGDQIILVNQAGTHAMGAQDAKKRVVVSVAAADGVVALADGVVVVTLEAGASEGTFALKVSDGYLYYDSSIGGNSIHTKAEKDAAASWIITIADGVASIMNAADNARFLQYNYNTNQERFVCYKGTQENVVIYKLSGDAPIAPPATEPSEPATEPTEPAAPVVPEGVNAPAADTAYNFGLYQAKNNKVVYVTGEVSGRYLSTTENVEEAAAVYAEAVDGGYKFYILVDGVKNYITVYNNDEGKLSVKYDAAGTSVYVYNAECNDWVTVMEGADYYLGTYNNFDTISASKTSYIKPDNTGVSQFPANLYAVAAEEPAPTEPVAPIEPPVDTGDAIGVVVALLAVSGTALVVLKKKEN